MRKVFTQALNAENGILQKAIIKLPKRWPTLLIAWAIDFECYCQMTCLNSGYNVAFDYVFL